MSCPPGEEQELGRERPGVEVVRRPDRHQHVAGEVDVGRAGRRRGRGQQGRQVDEHHDRGERELPEQPGEQAGAAQEEMRQTQEREAEEQEVDVQQPRRPPDTPRRPDRPARGTAPARRGRPPPARVEGWSDGLKKYGPPTLWVRSTTTKRRTARSHPPAPGGDRGCGRPDGRGRGPPPPRARCRGPGARGGCRVDPRPRHQDRKAVVMVKRLAGVPVGVQDAGCA